MTLPGCVTQPLLVAMGRSQGLGPRGVIEQEQHLLPAAALRWRGLQEGSRLLGRVPGGDGQDGSPSPGDGRDEGCVRSRDPKVVADFFLASRNPATFTSLLPRYPSWGRAGFLLLLALLAKRGQRQGRGAPDRDCSVPQPLPGLSNHLGASSRAPRAR